MSEKTLTTISAGQRQRLRQFFGDLWAYRDLFVALLERDIKVRYKQTVLGVTWVIVQPLVTAGAFSLIFGGIAAMPVGALPYPVFYIVALVPWVGFANGFNGAANSLVDNAGLISKIYFPRVIVPCAAVVGTLPDFLIGFLLVNVVAAAYGCWGLWLLVVMPGLLLLQCAAALGGGLFMGALNAQYRDIRYVVPFVVQIGMLATPVIYPLSKLPGWALALQYFNPMAGVVSLYRWAAGDLLPDPALLLANAATAALLLTAGTVFFRWRERLLVDVI